MFAQVPEGPFLQPYGPPYYEAEPSLFDVVISTFCPAVLGLLSVGLTVWMLVECLRKDPDRYLWVWIILFAAPPLGALVYFFLRWLPVNEIRLPQFLRRYARGRELDRLRLAATQIGNAHQHIQLADALRELGEWDEAAAAYQKALEKEPNNLQALWGAAQTDIHFDRYESARDRLKSMLEIDPQYKFGDVSLEYGRTLCKLDQIEAAVEHLEEHIRRWPQPEAMYLLASLHAEKGNHEQARSHLLSMMLDINSSPRGIARRQAIWKSRGRRLLRRLPERGATRR